MKIQFEIHLIIEFYRELYKDRLKEKELNNNKEIFFIKMN